MLCYCLGLFKNARINGRMPVIKIFYTVGLLSLTCLSLLQAQERDLHAEHVIGGAKGEALGTISDSVDSQAQIRVEDAHAGHDMGESSEEELNSGISVEDPHAGHVMGGEQSDHGDHNMVLDSGGMVMNNNQQVLPQDCTKVVAEYNFEVYAGTEFASEYPGTIYAMSQHEYLVEPCSSVTIKFVNTDSIRHQWMIHGLPRYLYPGGMFHLEAAGGQSREGTFIVPSDDKTYLVHCDMAQHMEMGMKAQLKAGAGSGDLWSIPGVSRSFRPDNYLPKASRNYLLWALLVGVMLTIAFSCFWRR